MPNSLDIRSAREIARMIAAEDAKVAPAVARALPQIAQAIDIVADAIGRGGRLIYVGAGTSGRIAALDAAECPPTFNTQSVHFIMAGGTRALWRPYESKEDSAAQGRRDMATKKPGRRDVVAGLAASGHTPYTLAALEYARGRGAKTVAITCTAGSPLSRAADIAMVAEVGPEVLSGSTRMKAGTAEKLICNMITTGAMARLGYVYGNLMVNVHPKNRKLAERAVGILQEAAGVERAEAARALKSAGNSVPGALVMLKAVVSRAEAQRRLKRARGNVRQAIEETQPARARKTAATD
jgi:N-acetylmuramic acid 6-phosphate etherase